MTRRLLVTSCSSRKRLASVPLPAIERYDGGTYRVIRKLMREGQWPGDIDVLIISAKFGLLDSSDLIPNYDLRMTNALAAAMNPDLLNRLRQRLDDAPPIDAYLDLSAQYLRAVRGIDVLFSHRGIPLHKASGRIGERLRLLKAWVANGGK